MNMDKYKQNQIAHFTEVEEYFLLNGYKLMARYKDGSTKEIIEVTPNGNFYLFLDILVDLNLRMKGKTVLDVLIDKIDVS